MVDEIIELINTKQYTRLKEILSEMEPADIAYLFDDLPEKYMSLLFRLLPKEPAAEVFVEIDADMQDPPEYLVQMYHMLTEDSSLDCVAAKSENMIFSSSIFVRATTAS